MAAMVQAFLYQQDVFKILSLALQKIKIDRANLDCYSLSGN